MQHIQVLTETHRPGSSPRTLDQTLKRKKKKSALSSVSENPTKPYVQLLTEIRGVERLRKPAEMLVNNNQFSDTHAFILNTSKFTLLCIETDTLIQFKQYSLIQYLPYRRIIILHPNLIRNIFSLEN